MKSMKVRKLAALGVAAAVAAVPVAFAAMHSDTLPTDRDWYLQSKVVVGANAIASDVVAAAEIAAAIAGLAYKEAEIQGGSVEDATVKLSVPGEIVTGGHGDREEVVFDPADAEIKSSITVTATDVPSLKDNEEVSYRVKESSDWKDEEAYISESIDVSYFNAEGYQPEDSQVSELRAYTQANAVKFVVDITGLDFTGGKEYNSDNFKGIEVEILGKTYKISKVVPDSGNSGSVTLTLSEREETIPVGGETELEGGYTLKVVDIDPDNKSVFVELYKDGSKVADDVLEVEGDNSTDFDGELEDEISVETVFAGTEKKFAKFQLASKTLTLDEGSGEQDEPVEGWTLTATKVDPDRITFEVAYTGDEDSTYLSAEKGLKPGEVMWFPGEKYGVAFEGFQSKPMVKFVIDGDKATVRDVDGRDHTVALYGNKSFTSGVDFTIYDLIDDKDVKMEVNTSSSPPKIDYDADLDGEIDDLDVELAQFGSTGAYYKTLGFDVDSDGSDEFNYFVIVDTTNNKVYYTLKTNNPEYNAPSSKLPYYIDLVTDTNPSDGSAGIVEFNVVEASGTSWSNVSMVITPVLKEVDTNVYVIDKIDFEDTDIVYANTYKFDSDSDSDDPVNGVSSWGTELYISGTSKVEVSVPTEQRKLKFFIGEPTKVEEAGHAMEAKVGDTVQIGDYEVKIEGIEGVANVQGTYYEKLDFDPVGMAILDTEADNTGNLIVVGGWNANQIAAKVKDAYPDIESELEQDKEIIGLYTVDGQEIILVAGWEAQDTRSAARNFIAWLKENVQ